MVEDSLGAAETQRRKTLLELCQSSAESSVDVRVLPPPCAHYSWDITTPPASERLGQNNTEGKPCELAGRPLSQRDCEREEQKLCKLHSATGRRACVSQYGVVLATDRMTLLISLIPSY
ncbi:hypothetical protein MHYP_G00070870 [Metynnis hypsauchen]